MRLDRVIVALFAVGLLAGGLLVVKSGNGEAGRVRTRADVISCHSVSQLHTVEDECYAIWTAGSNDPVLGEGRHVNGTIHDASLSDEGKTLTVYAKGDSAILPHGTNWRLAIFLWLLALGAVGVLARDVVKPRGEQQH